MSPNPQGTADLVTFAEEILNGKLIFYAVNYTVIFIWKTKKNATWK